MKQKLLISVFIWSLSIVFLYSQARIIIPESAESQVMADSLQPPQETQLPIGQTSQLNHLLHDHGAEADSLQKLSRMTIWTIDARTGSRLPAESDTILHNYQHTTLPDGESVAMGFLGPLGSPSFSKIFNDRQETEHFVFNNAYYPYIKRAEELLFVNTRVPYSKLDYHRSGNKQTREERFGARLTSNFGKSLNLGLDVDLINSKGFYNSQSVKNNNFSLFGSYLSDRFEGHAFMNLGKISNFENGGITDETFITDPESIQQSFTPRDIPIKFTNTWNTVGNNRYFISGRYNLGYKDAPKDSLTRVSGEFIPVASLGSHLNTHSNFVVSYLMIQHL